MRLASFIVLVVMLVCACTPPARAVDPASGEYDWGFIASKFKDVNGDLRFRAAGPFVEHTTSDSRQEFLAYRPVYCRLTNPDAERSLQEILWPVATTKKLEDIDAWRFLVATYLDFDRTDPNSRYRFWVFPLYFQGRDSQGKGYLALFPIGGSIHEFLRMDKISFALFPIWARNSIGEIKSQHWFWPIYARTDGEGIDRFRVFPFYGQSRHRDLYQKKFVMWPLWTSAIYNSEQSHGTGYMLFPLWGHVQLNDQNTWWVFPPLFKFGKSDRQDATYAPWPLYQQAEGSVEKLYLFPFWGKKAMPGSYKSFFLWPIFHRQRIDKGDSVYHRFSALPFVHSEVYRERDPDAIPRDRSRFFKLWPLLSYQREGEVSRLRMLDLWLSRRHGPVDRNLAPFWTLYSRTQVGEQMQSEFLWGLFRHHRETGQERYLSVFPLFDYRTENRDTENRSFSILKGLVGYERSGKVKSYRLLYLIRWGGKEHSP